MKVQRLPDLSGGHASVDGMAAGTETIQFPDTRSFWLHYFQAVGTDLPKERYGAALLSREEYHTRL